MGLLQRRTCFLLGFLFFVPRGLFQDPSIPKSIYPTTLRDYTAGMHLVQGILRALLMRDKIAFGQQVSVSLYNSMIAMQMQEAAQWKGR